MEEGAAHDEAAKKERRKDKERDKEKERERGKDEEVEVGGEEDQQESEGEGERLRIQRRSRAKEAKGHPSSSSSSASCTNPSSYSTPSSPSITSSRAVLPSSTSASGHPKKSHSLTSSTFSDRHSHPHGGSSRLNNHDTYGRGGNDNYSDEDSEFKHQHLHLHLHSPSAQQDNLIVRLNIGGHRFETTYDTLCSIKDSYFTGLLSGRIPSLKDQKGCYFIDRDGQFFGPLLTFLRTRRVTIPTNMALDDVLCEAEYFQIKPLVDELQRLASGEGDTAEFAGGSASSRGSLRVPSYKMMSYNHRILETINEMSKEGYRFKCIMYDDGDPMSILFHKS